MPAKCRSILDALFCRPVDVASLAAFRILFGLIMAGAMVRFMAKGWVAQMYIHPTFYFAYPGLEWVHPLPGYWMYAPFILAMIAALGVALGLFYRWAIVLFLVAFTYIELLDQTAYLNHYYLVSLISGLLVFMPANAAWSIDGWRKAALKRATVPAWTVNLLRFQLAVVYIFAGLAKLTADWLVRGEPLRIWLAARSDLPLIGRWLGEPQVALLASWTGALFDCSIVFFLINARTRKAAYLILIIFHVATWILFNIGMFPWIMIIETTIFFEPDWPRKILQRFARVNERVVVDHEPRFNVRWSTIAFVTLFGLIQLTLPLRAFFSREPVGWTCSNFNCAWRVMIVEKTGYVEFFTFDPSTHETLRIQTAEYLTPRQEMLMAQDPNLIRDMAKYLYTHLHKRGARELEIRVNAFASINGCPSQRLIKENINLAGPLPSDWVVPVAK
jgi:vitamin K-dependent gamma-carboxylase